MAGKLAGLAYLGGIEIGHYEVVFEKRGPCDRFARRRYEFRAAPKIDAV